MRGCEDYKGGERKNGESAKRGEKKKEMGAGRSVGKRNSLRKQQGGTTRGGECVQKSGAKFKPGRRSRIHLPTQE